MSEDNYELDKFWLLRDHRKAIGWAFIRYPKRSRREILVQAKYYYQGINSEKLSMLKRDAQ